MSGAIGGTKHNPRRRIEGLILDADHDLGNAVGEQSVKLGLGTKFAELLQIRARNWASSAKAGAGTDTAVRIRITDNNGDVVYLDAADRDYATAEVTLVPVLDDTLTGLGLTSVDATGAARAAGEAGGAIVMESPVLVAIVNGATATDFMTVDLIVRPI